MCNCTSTINKRTPHKHAELIKAWADGAEIEHFDGKHWHTSESPAWSEKHEYRIKPEQSDLDKYGVEVGDGWQTADLGLVFITNILLKGWYRNTKGCDMTSVSMKCLLFRRGVVNKL